MKPNVENIKNALAQLETLNGSLFFTSRMSRDLVPEAGSICAGLDYKNKFFIWCQVPEIYDRYNGSHEIATVRGVISYLKEFLPREADRVDDRTLETRTRIAVALIQSGYKIQNKQVLIDTARESSLLAEKLMEK